MRLFGSRPEPAQDALLRRLTDLVGLLHTEDPAGNYSVWLGPADSERPTWAYHPDTPHAAASMMKLAVAAALLRAVGDGALTLDQPVLVHPDFPSAVEGQRFEVSRADDDSPQPWAYVGEQVELGWLAEQMVSHSSNLATDLILEQIGLAAAAAVTQEIAGPPDQIARFIDDVPGRAAGVSNVATASGMARLLRAVVNGSIAGPATPQLSDWLADNSWNDEIPERLPDGVRVEHKNGWDDGVRHDCGVVYPADAPPFIVCVLTTSSMASDRTAKDVIAQIAEAAYEARTGLVPPEPTPSRIIARDRR